MHFKKQSFRIKITNVNYLSILTQATQAMFIKLYLFYINYEDIFAL